jgi:integrase
MISGSEPDARTESKANLQYWKERIYKFEKRGERSNWYVQLQAHGQRHALSLETSNKDTAAKKAKKIYEYIRANGWQKARETFRPKHLHKPNEVTVGQFMEEVKRTTDLTPKTLEDYSRAFRKIVADISGADTGTSKYDAHAGGYQAWLEKIYRVKLASLTPKEIQKWKRDFLAKAKPDLISQRESKTSVNSFLRRARSLFSPKITRHLSLELPTPLPFAGIAFEPRQSMKYHSDFKLETLIAQAREELSENEPEVFKIFALSLMVGLRRREIDLLQWSSFHWESNTIRIEPTEFFEPKSEDSIGNVQVDPELMQIFRGYLAKRHQARFVIASRGKPKPQVVYIHYRCQEHFKRLNQWLRSKGVSANKPLHTLRKEYGSQICALHGIHAASRALRHADISLTNEFYTDSRRPATLGLGHLLVAPSEKILDLRENPQREHISQPVATQSSAAHKK